jgi:hypothetical protein
MFPIHVRKVWSILIAVVAVASFVVAAPAATAAPNVTFSASGVFATQPVSGNDLFKLAGQPFQISVVASVTTVPKLHGAQWAVYGPLKMTGTVQSALLPTPIAIANNLTNIALAIGNPSYDLFQLGSPIQVVGLTIRITAIIQMPKGTIQKACSAVGCTYIQPFTAPVTLSPANATMSYTDGTNTTVLAIQSGTVNAVWGGTLTAWGAAWSAGVRDAADIHVRIARQEVPVPGLNRVSV